MYVQACSIIRGSLLQDLADKIAQLNSAIDDVSSQLKASDVVEETAVVS